MTTRARWLSLLAVLSLLACGSPSETDSGLGNDSGTVRDAGGGQDGGFQTAAHQPFPPVVYFDGGVIAAPQLVTIVYPGYPHNVQGWGDYALTSQWIHQTGADYGVGAGTHLAKVTVPDAVPATLSDALIEQNLLRWMDAGVIPTAPPTANNDYIYMLYLNSSVQMNDSDGGVGQICVDFLGYHYNFPVGANGQIYYGVVADCDPPDAGEAQAAADVESTAAHELMETMTDPGGYSWYFDVPMSNDWWEAWEYGEVGDLCEFLPNYFENGWSFQRIWSNSAAAAGGDPCVPLATGETAYWNASPPTSQVHTVAAGQTIQIAITGWSTAPVASWPLSQGYDYNGDDFDPVASLSTSTLNNGETATLTLTVPTGTGSGLYGTVFVYSDANQDDGWPVTIVTP